MCWPVPGIAGRARLLPGWPGWHCQGPSGLTASCGCMCMDRRGVGVSRAVRRMARYKAAHNFQSGKKCAISVAERDLRMRVLLVDHVEHCILMPRLLPVGCSIAPTWHQTAPCCAVLPAPDAGC
jgi:hypothetical protein